MEEDKSTPARKRPSRKKFLIAGIVFVSLAIIGVASDNNSQDKSQVNSPAPATSQSPITNTAPPKKIQATPQQTSPTSSPTKTPVQTTPSETVAISGVSSPAYPGSTATLTASTLPNSACSIVVNYKSGPSHAAGLYDQDADDSGSINWSWTVGTNTTPGTWPIEVTCTSNGQSATANTSFAVQ